MPESERLGRSGVSLTHGERQALLMASRMAMERCGAGGPFLESARKKLTIPDPPPYLGEPGLTDAEYDRSDGHA